MFEIEEGPKLRVTDEHFQRLVVQPSRLLRPGALAIITPPRQKVILLSRADATALRDYLNDYLSESEPS